MNLLDLFTGIGGFSLGLDRAGFNTIAFCEIEEYPRKVLKKHWPDVPIAGDIRLLSYDREKQELIYDGKTIYRGSIRAICGGFPCQDLSTAGRQSGIHGDRSGLWFQYARIIGEVRPDYFIVENVKNLISGQKGEWFEAFLCSVASLGYDAIWHCITASDAGAHHHRDRVWIVAYPNGSLEKGGRLSWRIQKEIAKSYGRSEHGKPGEVLADTESMHSNASNSHGENGESQAQEFRGCCGENDVLADTMCGRQQRQREFEQSIYSEAAKNWEAAEPINGCIGQIWEAEPGVGRVVDGVWKKSYGNRLKALGNAVVPQIPEIIGRAIMKIESEGLKNDIKHN